MLKGCSKSPQSWRPYVHNFLFQSALVIVNFSLGWMPHTHTTWQAPTKPQQPLVLLSDLLELPSKKQKVFVSSKDATAGSSQYVYPCSTQISECLWDSDCELLDSFLPMLLDLQSLFDPYHLFLGVSLVTLPTAKALTDWNGSCSIPLSVMLLKQLATASQKRMQSCKTPNVDPPLTKTAQHATVVEYHHLNMRISACHVCLPNNWFVCHLAQHSHALRKPPDLEGSPPLWHHFLSAGWWNLLDPRVQKW